MTLHELRQVKALLKMYFFWLDQVSDNRLNVLYVARDKLSERAYRAFMECLIIYGTTGHRMVVTV